MYMQVGDFCISKGPPKVQLMQILRNTIFFKSQNGRKAGTLCITRMYLQLHYDNGFFEMFTFKLDKIKR